MAPRASQLILDPFTYLSFKKTWSEQGKTEPLWTGEHQRRLQAYRILEHYFRNASRMMLDDTMTEAERMARREYGEAALLVNQVCSSVMGLGGMQIHVEGAELTPKLDQVPGTEPVPPPAPEDVLPTEDERTVLPAPTIEPAPMVEPPAPVPQDIQIDLLREWIKMDRFRSKQIEHERNCGKLGDGILVLGWSTKKNRPVMNVYDPGFYFPVYEADGSDEEGYTEDFPSKVHIAYEYEDEDEEPSKKRKIRRITWELDVSLNDNDDIEQIQYPWNDEPVEVTCWYSDGWWYASNDTDLAKLDESEAHWRIIDDENGEEIPCRNIDLGIDFIPVIHFPNMVAENEIWGTSTLSNILQILDDLQATDTDLQAASATTGSPPLSVKGSTYGSKELESYGPGTVFQSENGMDMLDTSQSLTALTGYSQHLLERLSVNSRIPESMLGRVKPSEVPSGIALWLSFAPHSTLIEEMRQVRQEKYSLLFKFVSRFYMLNGDLTKIFPVTVSFGPYLPADKSEILNMVVQGLNANTPPFSLPTAIKMLMDAGWPIESIATELAQIQSRDFAGASELVGVTGNPLDGAAYLGIRLQPQILEPTEEGLDEFGNPLPGQGLEEPVSPNGGLPF